MQRMSLFADGRPAKRGSVRRSTTHGGDGQGRPEASNTGSLPYIYRNGKNIRRVIYYLITVFWGATAGAIVVRLALRFGSPASDTATGGVA
jgi:hypothetical protein